MLSITDAAQDMRGGLRRAVVISLLTWRRAADSDAVDDADRQGWWGDAYPDDANDQIGSRLWLLRRRSLTAQTVRDAQTYIREALQWLIDDGQVTAVHVTVARPGHDPQRLEAVIALDLPDGGQLPITFDNLWQVIHAV